jgi:CRISPR/Cas system-associated protein Csx1
MSNARAKGLREFGLCKTYTMKTKYVTYLKEKREKKEIELLITHGTATAGFFPT